MHVVLGASGEARRGLDVSRRRAIVPGRWWSEAIENELAAGSSRLADLACGQGGEILSTATRGWMYDGRTRWQARSRMARSRRRLRGPRGFELGDDGRAGRSSGGARCGRRHPGFHSRGRLLPTRTGSPRRGLRRTCGTGTPRPQTNAREVSRASRRLDYPRHAALAGPKIPSPPRGRESGGRHTAGPLRMDPGVVPFVL